MSHDPYQTFLISLDGDLQIDVMNRRKFRARYLNRHDERQYLAWLTESMEEKDPAKSDAVLAKAMAMAFVDWENVSDNQGKPIAFKLNAESGTANFDEALGIASQWELARKFMPASNMNHVARRLNGRAVDAAATEASAKYSMGHRLSAEVKELPPTEPPTREFFITSVTTDAESRDALSGFGVTLNAPHPLMPDLECTRIVTHHASGNTWRAHADYKAKAS